MSRGLAPTNALLFQGPKGNGQELTEADQLTWTAFQIGDRVSIQKVRLRFLRVDEAHKYKLRVKGQTALGVDPVQPPNPDSGQFAFRGR